jgi:hypothetical protein
MFKPWKFLPFRKIPPLPELDPIFKSVFADKMKLFHYDSHQLFELIFDLSVT